MANIRKIEAVVPVLSTRKKVAAYARVSMETERLHHSLSAQISYYSDLIQRNPEWEYVGVYADNFITGTTTDKRAEFQRMLEDCESGKIDIILTKSISRFARNTVDLLKTVRHLKELGISVRFEKENIDSLSGDGEVMLTLLASFAQEEIISLSNNVKWGIRKRFEKGEPNFRNNILGYNWVDDHLEIVPEEAVVVRRIFQNFLDGKSRLETERELNSEGITTKGGYKWCDSNIKVILSNITYTGNLLLQKEYIADPITKKRKKNHGELPQYFVEDTHDAIIDMETFQYVQDEMARRKELGALANKSLNISCFTGKIKCPYCGLSYMHNRRVKNGHEQEYWNCGSKKMKKKGDGCPVSGTISQKALKKACSEVLGLEKFDEQVFLDKVDHIDVPKAYTLDFFLKDGTSTRIDAPNTGHQDCWTPEYRSQVSAQRRKNSTNPKGASCFTAKIKCADCGCNFRKATQRASGGGKLYYWRCADKKNCTVKGLREDWLKDLCAEIMEINEFDDAAFRKQIDHIDVHDGTELTFHFTDARTEVRQWREKRASHKCSEQQKEHMREVMKKKWNLERRKAMSESMKKIRSERYWHSTGKSKQSRQP